MKILVVDDDDDYAHMLIELLSKRINAQVTAVSSGKNAVAAMANENFDLVVCDFNMPHMTGHDVFQSLKDRGTSCPFLLFTNADLNRLPKFEGDQFLGVVRKTELKKLVERVVSISGNLP